VSDLCQITDGCGGYPISNMRSIVGFVSIGAVENLRKKDHSMAKENQSAKPLTETTPTEPVQKRAEEGLTGSAQFMGEPLQAQATTFDEIPPPAMPSTQIQAQVTRPPAPEPGGGDSSNT